MQKNHANENINGDEDQIIEKMNQINLKNNYQDNGRLQNDYNSQLPTTGNDIQGQVTNDLNMMESPDESQVTSNPYIFSLEESVSELSFCDSRQEYQKLSPPPKYFTNDYLLQKFALPSQKDEILQGFTFPESGGLICSDLVALEKQKGVLAHVAKQLAVNILKGLSISHISLPIKIFEPRSSIQRICDMWTFAPKFLRKAAEIDDHLERLKLVVAFAVSSIYMCCGQNKPFNPLLGETMQGEFPDGSKFFCEHTSHHPPISNFLLEDRDFLYKLYGYYEITGKMGANNFVSGLRGPNNVIFKDGHHIRFGFPSYRLGGTVMGDRTVETIGSCTFEDLTNNRKAVLLMNTFKNKGWIVKSTSGGKDQLDGIIYDSTPLSGDYQSIRKNYCKEIEFHSDLDNLKDVVKKICRIEGSWLKKLVIDQKVFWDLDKDIPQRQLPIIGEEILPSDWRYREDLIWLKYNYELIAHQWKLRLEIQQRKDRANRQACDKKQGRKRH